MAGRSHMPPAPHGTSVWAKAGAARNFAEWGPHRTQRALRPAKSWLTRIKIHVCMGCCRDVYGLCIAKMLRAQNELVINHAIFYPTGNI